MVINWLVKDLNWERILGKCCNGRSPVLKPGKSLRVQKWQAVVDVCDFHWPYRCQLHHGGPSSLQQQCRRPGDGPAVWFLQPMECSLQLWMELCRCCCCLSTNGLRWVQSVCLTKIMALFCNFIVLMVQGPTFFLMVTLASGTDCLTSTTFAPEQRTHYKTVAQLGAQIAWLITTLTEWLVWPAICILGVSVWTYFKVAAV